ncbi:hypothetical protein [Ligilactobacillus equi]|uniref:hypothetical protein n=1 Tax=Ligilactobacillus equi TaxID=137357 RepID=UPI00046856FF|nr:hypothetical protein [Ligilactobacillus equi]
MLSNEALYALFKSVVTVFGTSAITFFFFWNIFKVIDKKTENKKNNVESNDDNGKQKREK